MDTVEKEIEIHHVLRELDNCENDIPVFRKLIAIAPSTSRNYAKHSLEWKRAIMYLMRVISNNTELGNKRILLASHAFNVMLTMQCESHNIRISFQKLGPERSFCFLDDVYNVSNLELFKLVQAYGYLQTNRKDVFGTSSEYDLLLAIFDVIYINCMKYTRYSYFAYKILSAWLKRLKNTSDMRFWNDRNCVLERKLEAIIFSNWSNALNNLGKENAEIFNTYLQLMSQKYKEAFVDHIYRMCLKDMSWHNETKYIILAEIIQVHDMEVQEFIEKDFLFDLCISLTKNSLRCAGTKLYLAILKRVSEVEWKKMFGDVIKFVIDRWSSKEHKDHNALQSLFKYWLEPTIDKHKNILPFLWKFCEDLFGGIIRSHLLRMTAKRHELQQIYDKYKIDCYAFLKYCTTDREEITRLNAFTALCYCAADTKVENGKMDSFLLIKQFLWFNANTATVLIREGIIKYFRILCSNILKAIGVRASNCMQFFEFMEWLHEYFLDCFEVGSCYQRKILALNLYKTLLSFTNKNLYKSHQKEYLCYITAIDIYLKNNGSWKFTNKESLFLLLRLVLDSALDVKQLAATLILEYFEKDALSTTEKQILYNCAWKHCNSSKFYEIESGATLMKIMAHWLPLNEIFKDMAALFPDEDGVLAYSNYSELLLNEAKDQLAQMKSDILKGIVERRPFYGALTALLAIAFRGGPENSILQPKFIDELLRLLTDAVEFFLSAFSTKASNTVNSSSFAEMGLAIDEKIKTSKIENFDYDELQLSPAHQVLISCIWNSLKVSCEIASEIGMLMQSSKQVHLSMHVIVAVLMMCRHKGVVESAGVAIANLSRCLYNSKEYSELPKTYLNNLLENDTQRLPLTRRGSGLSILFHKLVVSDDRRNRPTVHFAVQSLLHSLRDSMRYLLAIRETEEDSPLAKRLHFLRALVADKEVHAHLVPYMENISLICFMYIKVDVWDVRNASLQLYGVVVSRLVGQCTKKDDEGFNFGNGYYVNHFVTHYPQLTRHMWAELRDVSKIRGTSNVALRSYGSIISVLTVLSKLSTSGCDLVDYPAKTFKVKVKRLLLTFFDNPMIHVRQLAAKVYAAFTPLNDIYSEMDAMRNKVLSSEVNMSHGCLLTYGYLRDKYIHDTRKVYSNGETENCVKTCWSEKEHFGKSRYFDILETWEKMIVYEEVVAQPCYILETLLLREFNCTLFARGGLSDDLIEYIMSSQKIQPGFFQLIEYWEQTHAKFFKLSVEKGLQLETYKQEQISRILDSSCVEKSIGFLKGMQHCIPLLEIFLKYLMSIRGNYNQLVLDEIVAFTLRTIKQASMKIFQLEFDKEIIEEFDKAEMVVATSSITRVKNSLILALSKCETLINRVLSYVYDLCMDEMQSVRLMAAEYIELAMHRFSLLKSGNQLLTMKCCMILLKDEISEIRESVAKLYNITEVFHLLSPMHEELQYQRLLSSIICRQIADDNVNFILYFTLPISRALRGDDSNEAIENPFHHNDSVFYKEESKFLNLCFLHKSSSNGQRKEDFSVVIHAIQTRSFRKLQEKAGFSYDDLQVILNLKEIDYISRKRDIIVQEWRE